jgi:hypothetical protein
MIIPKVHDIDTSRLETGGRTLKIKSKKNKTFLTPTIPFSRKEITAKSNLPFIGSIDGHLGAVQIDVEGERLLKFFQNNGTVKYVKRKIIQFTDITCCYDNFLILDVPPIEISNLSQFKLFMEIQLDVMTLDYVSIPPIETNNISSFEKLVFDWQKNAEMYGKGVVPQLFMNEDPDIFKKKLDVLCELSKSRAIDIINLKHAKPENNLHQFIEVWNHRDDDVIFNCYNVPSKGKEVYPNLQETPNMGLQRYGIDIITPIKKTPDPKFVYRMKLEDPVETTDALKYNWPYHPAASVLTPTHWKKLPAHNVTCSCKVCKNNNQSDIIEQYSYDHNGEINNSSMRYISTLHNSQSSELENQEIRKFIKGNEMDAYQSQVEDYREQYIIR